MGFQKILLVIIIIQGISSYYIYNADTNQVLSYATLNNLPEGFKIIRAPKYLTRRNKKTDTRGLSCPKQKFICDEPYAKSSTYQFECEYDTQCPKNYLCCSQNCFKHKVCSKGVFRSIKNPYWTSNSKNNSISLDAESKKCQKWPFPCSNIYPESFSYPFKCESDTQCPKYYLCCRQNCFKHKICSKEVVHVEELRKTVKTATTTTLDSGTTQNFDSSTADSDYSTADSDYSTADSDFSTADSDFSTADSDYSTADSDYSTADSDFSTADSDFSTADSDFSTADSDFSTADSDFSTADSDFSTADFDDSTANSESSTADSDSSTWDPNAIYPEFFYSENVEVLNEDYSEGK
ncbi:uncharacterized protein LOC130452069 [Diorhabda sublineata]|uniref:uncharacterized protein LOC130452069 n=1 Tax=Diorhabda sublineata TaxID=1163346 RepID=UPI0024E14189|nr:uncharacterized protein LOC130452069 [Diorhabda sublineata]